MPRQSVEASAHTSASADQAWAVVSDFCAPWHPAVSAMVAEQDGPGLIRRFTVADEDTVYRERLTFYSGSDRVMAYTHVSGIAGVLQYDARLSVTPREDGAEIVLAAEIEAPAGRLAGIAQGTGMIFDTGCKEIAALALGQGSPPVDQIEANRAKLKSVRIGGAPELALSVAGPSEGPLVLFLHGIGGNRDNWTRQLSGLGAHYRMAALDLRGYGDSQPGLGQTGIDACCTDILRVRDQLGASELVLCGLSYGAWIATSFATRHPHALDALVLAGGCTGMSEASAQERSAFLTARETPLDAGQTPADFAPSVVDVIAGPNATDSIRNQLLASMEAIPAQTYKDALRCFANPPEVFDFSAISVPVLLMTGEHDRLAPPEEIRSVALRMHMAAADPDIRFEVIKGAGHVCNLEQPERFNAVLAQHLSRILQ